MKPKRIRVGNVYALVDAEDYEALKQYTWSVIWRNAGKTYARTTVHGKQITMHRMILGIEDPKVHCDHINGVGLDNRRSNLRPASSRENGRNRAKKLGHSASQFKGVTPHRRSFKARIWANGKSVYLGCFKNESDAALAYDVAAMKYFRDYLLDNYCRLRTQ